MTKIHIPNKVNKGSFIFNNLIIVSAMIQSFKPIKSNKVHVQFRKTSFDIYDRCSCRVEDEFPCTRENGCVNALSCIECSPEFCGAKERCRNQNFQRGKKFSLKIKSTQSKGLGLFSKNEIHAGAFVIEYIGEIIDEFEQTKRALNRGNTRFFFKLNEKLIIDATEYANEARFINHSCNANTKANKMEVYSNGQLQTRVGFYALRQINPVCLILNNQIIETILNIMFFLFFF